MKDLKDEIWSSFSVDLGGELIESVIADLYSDTLSWIGISGDDALESLENIFMELTVGMGMQEEDSVESWNSENNDCS